MSSEKYQIEMDIEDSDFLYKYVTQMTSQISTIHPEWDEKAIKKVVMMMVDKEFTNPTVEMDNNFTHTKKRSTLLSVVDWYYGRQPILAGNGTFYRNQDEAINPQARFLEDMGTNRKAFKKQMFKCQEGSPEYKAFDLKQANEKIKMNSYYGASGLSVSAFYSLYSGPATTLTAQSVISTTETAFEAFLGDNHVFIDLNEFFDWAKCMLDEEIEIDDWIERIDPDTLYNRLSKKFWSWKDKYEHPLRGYVENLTSKQRTILYYKNNIRDFTSAHPIIQDLYRSIYSNVRNIDTVPKNGSVDDIPADLYAEFDADMPWHSKDKVVKDYNSWVGIQRFLNPNEVPKEIKSDLEELTGYFMKYCYARYLVPDRIHRLKYFTRKVVVVVDTDSNMLNLQPWVTFIENNVLHGNSFGRSDEYNMFIGVNTTAYIITQMVTDILLHYGKMSNIPERFRPKFNMKNEFLFKKIVIAMKKKRYISAVVLREGNLFDPPKRDEKGMDYIKSGCSESAMNRYRDMTFNRLLNVAKVDPKGLFDDVNDFKFEIRESLENGEKQYLPNASAKEPIAYKNPWSEQSVRAVYAWNCIYPDQQIEVPCKVNIVKLNIFKPSDIAGMEFTYPDVYRAIMNGIFNSPNPAISSKGCQVLAIPNTVQTMPEWTKEYIDYTTMTSDILSPFKCIMELVKFSQLKVGKSSTRQSKVFSNIIKF